MCWDGMGRSPTFEFPSKKAITWVQTSRNVDISWNSNGHISVVRDATVTWLGKLLVLHVLCMLMWSWPNPRSRSRGFSTSENCWSRACWRWWPSATLWGFLVLLFIVAHVFCQITTYTVLCMLSDVLMNDCLWRCLETPVCIKLPFKHWGRRCCQHSQKTPAALWQRPAVCQVALSLSSTSTTALMVTQSPVWFCVIYWMSTGLLAEKTMPLNAKEEDRSGRPAGESEVALVSASM